MRRRARNIWLIFFLVSGAVNLYTIILSRGHAPINIAAVIAGVMAILFLRWGPQ